MGANKPSEIAHPLLSRQAGQDSKVTNAGWVFRDVETRFPCDPIPPSSNPLSFVSSPHNLDLLQIATQDEGSLTLQRALSYLYADSLVVLREGAIVAEQYHSGMKPDTPHLLFSASKPFAAALVMNLIHDGWLGSEDDDILEYLPELKTTAFAGVTVRHLLDMQSGINLDDLGDPGILERSIGFAAPLKDESIANLACKFKTRKFQPGSETDYLSINTDLLSLLATRLTGRPGSELLHRYILDPMGAEYNSLLVRDQEGVNAFSGGLAICARDLAKFGQALLKDGEVNGSQILPSGFVEGIFRSAEPEKWAGSWIAQLTPQAKAYRSYIYLAAEGFDPGAYFAVGNFGNALYIQPRTQAVIALQCSYPTPVDLPRFNTQMTLLREIAHAVQVA